MPAVSIKAAFAGQNPLPSIALNKNPALEDSKLTKTQLITLISAAENKHGIPAGLLRSIAKIESGFKPFALNIAGKTLIFNDKAQMVAKIQQLLKEGTRNIDIGVMQINYHWHHKQFKNLEEIVSIPSNIEYSAKLLKNLYSKHGSWHKALRLYHSANSHHHKKYSRKVVITWLQG